MPVTGMMLRDARPEQRTARTGAPATVQALTVSAATGRRRHEPTLTGAVTVVRPVVTPPGDMGTYVLKRCFRGSARPLRPSADD